MSVTEMPLLNLYFSIQGVIKKLAIPQQKLGAFGLLDQHLPV